MNMALTLSAVSVRPLRMYFDLPSATDLVIITLSAVVSWGGLRFLSELSNIKVTSAFVTPALPRL